MRCIAYDNIDKHGYLFNILVLIPCFVKSSHKMCDRWHTYQKCEHVFFSQVNIFYWYRQSKKYRKCNSSTLADRVTFENKQRFTMSKIVILPDNVKSE